jgi:hypothetical protein
VNPKAKHVRSYVRIYSSELCPRQDSNLRSRLRRAWHHLALTSGNVPAGDPFGHILGTGRITAGHGLADRPMACRKPGERPPREPYPAPGMPHRPWQGWRALSTLIQVTETRLALRRRLGALDSPGIPL